MKAPYKARRAARWPWVCLAGALGAIVGVYLFALYAFHHPHSWAGHTLHRVYRAVNPWDGRADARVAARRTEAVPAVEAPAVEAPQADEHGLRPAPEVVHINEPLVIEPITVELTPVEPPVVSRDDGFEESEFPRVAVHQATSRMRAYMPYADEPTCAWAPCCLFPFFSNAWCGFEKWASAEYCEVRCGTAFNSCAGLTGSIVASQFSSDWHSGCVSGVVGSLGVCHKPCLDGGEEAGVAEEQPSRYAPEQFNPQPPHCPYTGRYPSHYRPLEIPATKPAMPEADGPMSPE